MRAGWRAGLLAVGLTAAGCAGATAQDASASPPPMAVLTLDQDRLFSGSRFGARSIESLEVLARTLQAENRRIEGDLEAEERDLTERRGGMTPEAFRTEAEAFDAKVKAIRSAQAAKARDLAAQRDAARQRFLQASAPVLAQILRERGAVAILDRSAIVLSFDRADVTDLAIARLDAILLDETAEPERGEAASAPGEAAPKEAAPPDPAAPPQP